MVLPLTFSCKLLLFCARRTFRITFTLSFVMPFRVNLSLRATPLETSNLRPLVYGPLSFTIASTRRPLRRLVMFTFVPKGRSREARVSRLLSNRLPEAVTLPSKPGPYHDATPINSFAKRFDGVKIMEKVRTPANLTQLICSSQDLMGKP